MIIFRYLIRETLITMGAVAAVLLLVIMGNQFIDFFSDAAEGQFPISLVSSLMAYQFPSFLQLILPMAFFLGFMMSFGQLYMSNEMIALQAGGIGPVTLLKISLWPGIGIAAIVALCSLWLTPAGLSRNAYVLNEQSSQLNFSLVTPGSFQELGDGRTVYIQNLKDNKTRLNNIFMSEDHDGRLVITRADSGYQYTPPHSHARYLQLSDGYRYEVTPGSTEASRAKYETYSSLLKNTRQITPDDDPQAASTLRLWQQGDKEANGELQFRVGIIIMIPVLVLIGLSLSKINPRQGRMAKLVPAIVIYIVYMSLLVAAENTIQSGWLSPYIGTWPIHLVFLMLGLWLLRRTFGHRGTN